MPCSKSFAHLGKRPTRGLAGLLAGAAGYAVMFAVFALLPLVGLAIVLANSKAVKERESQHG